jgi:hypothetical protein
MQSSRDNRNRHRETRRRTVSLDQPKDNDSIIDLKLLEAIERLERVQSKALNALGSILSASA